MSEIQVTLSGGITVTESVQQISVEQTSGPTGATGPAGPTGPTSLPLINSGTFTNMTQLVLDSIFTSTYRDYVLRWDFTSVSGVGTTNLQFRRAGSTQTSAQYQGITASLSSAYAGTSYTANTSAVLTNATLNSSGYVYELTITKPKIATMGTGFRGVNQTSYISNTITLAHGTFQTAIDVDGLLLAFSASCSGTWQLFGIVNP